MALTVPGPAEGCRFCIPQTLRDPIYVGGDVVLMPSLDAAMQPLPGQYTVCVPGSHATHLDELPYDMLARVVEAMHYIPELAELVSAEWPPIQLWLNYQKAAGGTVLHLHVNVRLVDPASPTAGMGPGLLNSNLLLAIASITDAIAALGSENPREARIVLERALEAIRLSSVLRR